MRADWVVGCDGAHSLVRRSLGLVVRRRGLRAGLADGGGEHRSPAAHDHFHLFAHTTTPLPVFPMPGGRWRVFVPQVAGRSRRAATARHGGDRAARRDPGPCRHEAERSEPARDVSLLSALEPGHAPGTGADRGRRRPRPQPGRRAGHEHRAARRLQPRLEARAGSRRARARRRCSTPIRHERGPIAAERAWRSPTAWCGRSRSPRRAGGGCAIGCCRWSRRRRPSAASPPGFRRSRTTTAAVRWRPRLRGRGAVRSTSGDRLPGVRGLRLGDGEVSMLGLLQAPMHTLLVMAGRGPDPASPGGAWSRASPVGKRSREPS